MPTSALALRQLAQQRLAGGALATPAEVVRWLGAVQAQDYLGAKWALGMRTQGAVDDEVERACDDGAILRTHVMRPTWHFVAPADIRWMERLTAPRVKAANAFRCRQLELDEAQFARSNEIIGGALRGGHHLTRPELGSALARAGIAPDGQRLAYLVMRAELDLVVCSGPRRGKQFTYALLEERVPPAQTLERDAALAELTRRYFAGHGPATVRDFAWWSGLTVAEITVGLELASATLVREVIEGKTYWRAASPLPASEPDGTALLLPTFDEFLVGYAAYDARRRGGVDGNMPLLFNSTIALNGEIAGTWQRTLKRGSVVVEATLFAPPTAGQSESIAAAAQRYGTFLGLPVEVAWR